MTTPPYEPMVAFAGVAILLYLLGWWLWWVVLSDESVELEYSEEEDEEG